MSGMKPCKDPRICGVKNHRPGTVCRAERSGSGKQKVGGVGLSTALPSASSSGSDDPEYGSLTMRESKWSPTSFSLDQDTYNELPEVERTNKAAAESIRNFSEFRQATTGKWPGVHAAWTGEEGDVYTVLKGDQVIAFRDVNGDFVMYNQAAGHSYGPDQGLVHAASRMDPDGNITPDGTPTEFPVHEVDKESEFNDRLKRHLSGEAQDDMPLMENSWVAFREGKVTPEGLTAAKRQILRAPKGKAVRIHGPNAEELGATSIKREPNGEWSLTLHRMGSELRLEANDNLDYLVRRAANR